MQGLGSLIATVARPSTAEAVVAARSARAAGADRVEIRLDALAEGEDPASVFPLAAEMPLLIAGARDRVRPGERRLLMNAQAAGAWVDLPWAADLPDDLFGLDRTRLVLSWHDSADTPADLGSALARLRDLHPAVAKIVSTARDFPDVLAVRDLLAREGGRGDLCAFAMGAPGVPSRILALAWGSCSTYASAPGGTPAAPGQLNMEEMLDTYRLRELRANDPLYALIGWPLERSRSPALFNAWFGAAGLPDRYLPFPTRSAAGFLEGGRTLGLAGVAVTIPHKEAVLANCSQTSRLVRLLGACNTLAKRERGWFGVNTDVFGVRRALASLPRGSRCLILGNGGAAAAAALALRSIGPTAVSGRDSRRTVSFARRFHVESVPWGTRARAAWDLLVNATPVGQSGEESPMPGEGLSGRWLLDMVVRP